MSREEFDMLPIELGWKCDYSGGKAHFTPTDHIAYATVRVEPRSYCSPIPMRPVSVEDQNSLVQCFADAFHDTIEYCDCDRRKTENSGRKLLRDFFMEKRGKPLRASRLALVPSDRPDAPIVAGGALILEHKGDSAMLDLLFVHPSYRRQGLATALVQTSINDLHRIGKTFLVTRYHLGNSSSRAWHAHFGFVEEPDLILTRLYLASAQQEYLRGRQRGELNEREQHRLLARCEQLRNQIELLETAARKEGMEGAFAAWRHQT